MTIELTVRPWEAAACHVTYEEEVEGQISADIKEAVDTGVQSAYLQGIYLHKSACLQASSC